MMGEKKIEINFHSGIPRPRNHLYLFVVSKRCLTQEIMGHFPYPLSAVGADRSKVKLGREANRNGG